VAEKLVTSGCTGLLKLTSEICSWFGPATAMTESVTKATDEIADAEGGPIGGFPPGTFPDAKGTMAVPIIRGFVGFAMSIN